MYVGRFIIVGPGIGAYRVSSRSFPDRKIVEQQTTLTVVPTADAPETDNPYVSYNCLQTVEGVQMGSRTESEPGGGVVLGNGSHVDPITEKLTLGYPARDALVTALHSMDYEKDDYDTPRIAGIVSAETALVGIVRHDALLVKSVEEPTLMATYEKDSPESFQLAANSAREIATEAYNHPFEHAVCAAGVTVQAGDTGHEITTVVHNGN